MFILLLAISIQQHDAIIQREHRLQDRSNKIGSDRYRRQKRIRTHIEHDSQTRRDQNHHRFEPRLGHQEEHQSYQHRRDNHHRDRGCGAILTGLYHAIASKTIADLFSQRLLVHRFRHIQVKDGVGAIGTIAIGDAMNIRIGLQQGPDTRYLLGFKPIEHHMHIRP